MKQPHFKDIPTLINALNNNQIIMDYLNGEITKASFAKKPNKQVILFLHKEFDKTITKRTKMAEEVHWWMRNQIKDLVRKQYAKIHRTLRNKQK